MKDYHFIEGDNILPSLESPPHLSDKLKNATEHSLCVREEQIYFGLGVTGRYTVTSHINYFSCPQSFFSQMLLVEIRETPTLKLCYYVVYGH